MKFVQLITPFLLAPIAASAVVNARLPLVKPKELENKIKTSALLERSQTLEDFAYATPERNRLVGGTAHNRTVDYIFKTLKKTGYYDVEKQFWSTFASDGVNATLRIAKKKVPDVSPFDFSANGTVSASLVVVNNLGCEAGDYPAEVEGKIALISRGTCEFGLKSALAGNAGAKAAIIYNNVAGNFTGGTLGIPGRPEGDYIATVGITQERGQALIEQIGNGPVKATVNVLSFYHKAYTANVIAETKGGDHDNVLAMGGHTDSVAAGPGINDDGSGIVGILEVAVQLAKYRTLNAVRFGFWAGEEEGLLGSTYYVEHLDDAELNKIRLYLNYDMIASPNYVYAIYDGDGSSFNVTGPKGSGAAEHFYQKWYENNGHPYTATAFDGRSDYGPFLEANIPCGGLFTGAEELKTEEEAATFGGTAGVALDPNYHGAGDNVANLNPRAFLVNTKLIAYSTAFYSKSFRQLGTGPVRKRAEGISEELRSYLNNEGRRKVSRRTGLPLPERM